MFIFRYNDGIDVIVSSKAIFNCMYELFARIIHDSDFHLHSNKGIKKHNVNSRFALVQYHD